MICMHFFEFKIKVRLRRSAWHGYQWCVRKVICICICFCITFNFWNFWNYLITASFQKLLSYMCYGGNVVRVLVHFFFTAAHFHLAFLAASISHFLTTTKKFSCCFPNKKMTPLFFISRSRSLLPFFWMTFASLLPTFSFSLSLSFSIFQISGHDN